MRNGDRETERGSERKKEKVRGEKKIGMMSQKSFGKAELELYPEIRKPRMAINPKIKIAAPAILFIQKIPLNRILALNLLTTELIKNHQAEEPANIPAIIVKAGAKESLSKRFRVVNTARNAKRINGLVKVRNMPEKKCQTLLLSFTFLYRNFFTGSLKKILRPSNKMIIEPSKWK